MAIVFQFLIRTWAALLEFTFELTTGGFVQFD